MPSPGPWPNSSTSAPSSRSTVANVRVSARRGVPRKINFSSVSRPATMRAARRRFSNPKRQSHRSACRPPEMTISSIVFFISMRPAPRVWPLCGVSNFRAKPLCQLFLAFGFFITCFSAHCSCLFIISFGQLVMLRHPHCVSSPRRANRGAEKSRGRRMGRSEIYASPQRAAHHHIFHKSGSSRHTTI